MMTLLNVGDDICSIYVILFMLFAYKNNIICRAVIGSKGQGALLVVSYDDTARIYRDACSI